MLGIGMQEILIILVVALIVIGPKRLPELARTLGKGFAEFKKAADDLQDTVRMDLERDRHEQFREKYPHLVPEEDQDSDLSTEGASSSAEAAEDGSDDKAEDKESVKTAGSGSGDEEVISYNPEEIEGGDEDEDGSDKGPADDTRDV